MSQRALRITSGFLLGLTILLYLGQFFVYARYAAALIQFPFDYDQGEGFELNDSVLFARGEWPYRSNEVYPFYASNYPPLYHLWLAPFVWVFGPAYWYGRAFSFLSTLVTAGAIGYAVHRATRDKPISLLAGLAYLASNYVYHIGPLFRQHISMVMFETLAVVTLAPLARADTPTERKRLFFGLLFLLAAGYTKQLAYATAAVCLLFVLKRGIKRGLVAAGLLVGIAAFIFGLINLATEGQWWVNIILANVNEFIFGQMVGLYKQWYGLHPILIGLTLLFGLLTTFNALHLRDRRFRSGVTIQPGRKDRKIGDMGGRAQPPPHVPNFSGIFYSQLGQLRSHMLYVLWFAAAVANGALAGKWGAGESYFTTAVAAACICAGIMLGEWRRLAARWPVPLQWGTAIVVPFFLISQATYLIHLPTQGSLFGPAWRALYATAQVLTPILPSEPLSRLLTADPEARYPELRELHFGVLNDAGVYIDSEGVLQYYDSQGYTQLGRPPTQIDAAQGYKLLAYTRAARGPVLTEEAAFALLAGKDQVGNPTQLLNLAKNSMLDSTALIKMIEAQAFEVIILRAQFYPLPVLYAIGQAYQPVATIPMNGFYYRVYTPKQESSHAP